jgi:AraC-like DNA-binding protein
MKLHLLNREGLSNNSFGVEKHSFSHFLKMWHYHPELELIYSIEGSGTRFVGDNIEQFNNGEIVLIGKNLPHMWLSDKEYFEEDSKLRSRSIVFHFKEDFLGTPFFEIPEVYSIQKLFKNAKYGIKFNNPSNKLYKNIKKALNKKGFERTLTLLQILHLLAEHQDYDLLASKGYVDNTDLKSTKNFTKAYEYIFKNFHTDITLTKVAELAHMNPTAFSRSFKRIHQKTFSRYLNEIRIGYACKLLTENRYPITTICYESGYNNLSNFNRQFKSITGRNPSEFLSVRNIKN